jgi:hypothetical protein
MTAITRTERRLLGFDIGDWSVFVFGLALISLLTLLI